MLLWAWAFGVRYGDMSETIEQTIMAALEAAAGKSVLPADIARRIAGHDEKAWSRQMKPVRAAALSLARQGKIVFLRKGRRGREHHQANEESKRRSAHRMILS